jgi:predicted GIY-YIG superfamily endonuclease
MNNFHYVYILQSWSHPKQIYTGITANLKQRLAEHNARKVPHTSKFTPWEIRTATAFKSKESASSKAVLAGHFSTAISDRGILKVDPIALKPPVSTSAWIP